MTDTNTIQSGQYVEYTYRLTDADTGALLFEAKEDAPDEMIFGVSSEIVPGLVEAVKGLKAGDKFDVTLSPEAAFGERYPDNIVTLEKEIFERDGEMAEEVTVGADLPMMTAEGYRITGKVLAIDDKGVTMDFNHPFAGMKVRFEGSIITVRPATPEEMKPSGGCCGGGCSEHGGCGDGCGGGCGSHGNGSCGEHGGCCH